MADGDLAMLTGDGERLAFAHRNFSGGGITHVTNRAGAGQTIEGWLIESFRDIAHRALSYQTLAVGRNHAARFLAAMLQRVQAEISQARRFRMAVDAKHAALFMKFVFQWIDHAFRLSRLRVAFNHASQSGGKTRPRIRVINMPARRDRGRKQRRSRARLLKYRNRESKANRRGGIL